MNKKACTNPLIISFLFLLIIFVIFNNYENQTQKTIIVRVQPNICNEISAVDVLYDCIHTDNICFVVEEHEELENGKKI